MTDPVVEEVSGQSPPQSGAPDSNSDDDNSSTITIIIAVVAVVVILMVVAGALFYVNQSKNAVVRDFECMCIGCVFCLECVQVPGTRNVSSARRMFSLLCDH